MKKTEKEVELHSNKNQPYRMRLPGFVLDEDIGLGDLIQRATYSVGLRPKGGCGCQRRGEALNRWVVFSSRHS